MNRVALGRMALVTGISLLSGMSLPVGAQNAHRFLHRVDSVLSKRYWRSNVDTNYIVRPKTKWTVTGRLNVSGARIKTEGVENGWKFKSQMDADCKSTVSVGVNYLGISLSVSLNPAKLLGRYKDFEMNFCSYGNRFGFDMAYQDARNFKGWHEFEGMERITLPADVLKVKTLNLNAYYAFNHRRFSYPAAFSQSYIQCQSAGSFLLGASAQGQWATVNGTYDTQLKVTNIAVGAGYGYNYVPASKWLLHISALPTIIFYSHASLTIGDERIPLHYHFPEVIITGRGAVVRQVGKNKFAGLSMVYNFTSIGDKDALIVQNTKWRIRGFFGFRF